jgi:hypothetical protein
MNIIENDGSENAMEHKLICTLVKPFEYSKLTIVKTVLKTGR